MVILSHQFGAGYAALNATTVDGASQVVKNPPANAGDMRHKFDPWEDPLEEGMATHSSILAWRIPWTEGPDWLHFIVSQRMLLLSRFSRVRLCATP